MSENKKVFFIINKFSGTGYRSALEGRILETCEKLGIECTIEFTSARGHATELARDAVQQKMDAVFAVGGDGTVNETAQGLLHTGVPMGILPKGSGNGLARHLGIPMSFGKSLKLIGSTNTIEMDTVYVNGILSVNVAGIGFDAHVASLFGKDGKRGLVGYTRLVVKEFFSYREFKATFIVGDQTFQREAFLIALANASQFGNNARIAPQASLCDGLLDICFVRKIPIFNIPAFALKMFSGQLNTSYFVDIQKASQLNLHFTHPMPFHIDGEAMEAAKDFSVRVDRGALKMLVPRLVSGF